MKVYPQWGYVGVVQAFSTVFKHARQHSCFPREINVLARIYRDCDTPDKRVQFPPSPL